LTVAEPVSELEIKVYGLVRTRDTNGVVGMTPLGAAVSHLSQGNPPHRRFVANPGLCRALQGAAQERPDRDPARGHARHRRCRRVPQGRNARAYHWLRGVGARADLVRLNHALKCSVGPPIDLLIYRRNSLKKDFTIRLEDDDPYLQAIRDGWGGAIHKAFHDISHDPGWTF